MVTRRGGSRRRTRRTFAKDVRKTGKVSISRYLQEFKEGEKVCLQLEPSVAKGRYFQRFHGNSGVVQARRGNCYELEIKHKGTKRTLFVAPVHLKRMQ